jgi:hypothetical protein
MADRNTQTAFRKERTPLWWARLTVRWLARLTATLLLALVVLIFVGEGLLGDGGPNPAKMDWTGRLMFVATFLTVTGFAVLWWRELLGGLLVIAATAAFYGLNYYASGKFPRGAFPLFYIPGILAILSWSLSLPVFQRESPA